MTVTNPADILMAVPDYRIDNIVGITSGSFSISAPTVSVQTTNASQSFTTGFSDTCLFQGIFSVDSGASWNDFGVYIPNLTTAGQPVLQTVTCQGWVTAGGTFTAYGTNWWDLVHSNGTAYTIQYKVAFFARDDQGPITPIPTNEIIKYSSGYNFQKIFTNGSFANTSGTTTITHNLGYVPNVRAWFTSNNSSPFPSNSLLSYDWAFAVGSTAIITSTTVTFPGISGIYGTGNTMYRIYLDS